MVLRAPVILVVWCMAMAISVILIWTVLRKSLSCLGVMIKSNIFHLTKQEAGKSTMAGRQENVWFYWTVEEEDK